MVAGGGGGSQGAGVARSGGTFARPTLESLSLTGAHPVPSCSSQLHFPGLETTSTTLGGLGGRRAVSGSPRCSLPRWPALRSSQPPVSGQFPSSANTFSISGSPRPLSSAYLKEFAFPNGASSTQGVLWGGNLKAKDAHSKPED